MLKVKIEESQEKNDICDQTLLSVTGGKVAQMRLINTTYQIMVYIIFQKGRNAFKYHDKIFFCHIPHLTVVVH